MTKSSVDDYLESQYNVVAGRPDFEQVLADWTGRSLVYRSGCKGFSQHRYGKRENEVIDLFPTQEKGTPIMVYLHGGYWQRGDRALYGFLAKPFNESGINVAIVGYPFAPSASMWDIIDSIKAAILWLWRNTREMGMDSDQMILVGHSAGGHLATIMQTRDWMALEPAMSGNPFKAVVSVSGLYWLKPLCSTTLNENLNLDKHQAEKLSPTEMVPMKNVPMALVIGDAEGHEFFAQANRLAMAWDQYGVPVIRRKENKADHFDVVYRIADKESELFKLIMRPVS